MELFDTKEKCCACGACMSICPNQAIEMVVDERGFPYPVINKGLCVECGLCRTVCAFQNDAPDHLPKKVFAGISREQNLVLNSSSGGVFAAIAEKILRNGGVVCGVAYDHNMRVTHIIIDDVNELIRLQGSKYVQSDMDHIYLAVKTILLENRIVLFSGTPCQIHGLRSFLGKDYENLFLIDIVCHGVPSEQVFLDYIHILENKIGGKISNFKFRDKKNGWGTHMPRIDYMQNGISKSLYLHSLDSSFYKLYLKANIYRENCYKCKYAVNIRVGDITLGDYWGINEAHPEVMKDSIGKNGVSAVLCNTEKGIQLLEACTEELILYPSDIERAQKRNPQLTHPVMCNTQERERFFRLYAEGYPLVEEDYNSLKNNIKKIIILMIPEKVKRKIRKYLQK